MIISEIAGYDPIRYKMIYETTYVSDGIYCYQQLAEKKREKIKLEMFKMDLLGKLTIGKDLGFVASLENNENEETELEREKRMISQFEKAGIPIIEK